MTARDEILGRIQEGLRVPAPRLWEAHSHGGDSAAAASGAKRVSDWLPPVGESLEDRIALFAANAAALRAEFEVFDDQAALHGRLAAMASENQWKSIASHHTSATDAASGEAGVPVVWTDNGYEVSALEACDAGITTCEALVAQTGSVLITAGANGGRVVSVLPPHHVVIATADQLLPDLPAAFARLKSRYGTDYPSFATFITGPSRTGDIERILVLGAHGPKRLTILMLRK